MTLLCAVVGSLWAEETTDEFIFTSRDWSATLNGEVDNWEGQRGSSYTAGQGTQVCTSATGAYATSPYNYSDVSKIVVTYCTNNKAGKGTVKVQVGDNTEQSFDVTAPSSGGTTLKTHEFTYSPKQRGKVKLTVNCTTNSIYIYSVAITHTPYTGGATTPDVSFDSNSIELEKGKTATNTISKPDDLTVTYSSSNTSIATVNSTTGEVTGVAEGTATITASWAAVANTYNAGTASYTVTVTAAAQTQKFVKVTNANQLLAGNKYILVAFTNSGAYAMGAQNGNIRNMQNVVPTTDGDLVQITTSQGVAILTLGGSKDAWTLNASDNNQYLSWTSGNYIKSEATVSSDNQKWIANSDEDGFYLANKADDTRIIQCNYSSSRFACYTGTQENGILYVLQGSPIDDKETATVSIGETELAVSGTTTITADPAGLAFSCESSNTAVATVADGTVTAVAAGTATITVSWEEQTIGDLTYKSGSQTFDLTVTSSDRTYYVKVTDMKQLVAGNEYIIVGYSGGNPYTMGPQGNNKFREEVAIIPQGEKVFFNNSNVATFTLGGTSGAWTFEDNATNKLLCLAASGNELHDTGLKPNATEAQKTWTVTTEFYLKNNDYERYILFNHGSNRFACYTGTSSTITPAYLYVKEGSPIADKEIASAEIEATKLAVPGQGVSTTAITTTPEGLVVSYTSSNESIATVADGTVTAVAGGDATITASWEGQTVNGLTYDAGNKEFAITVYEVEDGKFDFTTMVLDYGSDVVTTTSSTSYITESTWTAGNVTLVVDGKHRWWGNDGTLRFDGNSESTATISVPEGSYITDIEISGTNLGSDYVSANKGEYDGGTWTGYSQSVTFTVKSLQAKTITVTYETVPLVALDPETPNPVIIPYTGATDERVYINYNNDIGVSDIGVVFYDADQTTPLSAAPSWFEYVGEPFDGGGNLMFTIPENTGVERTLYLKVWGTKEINAPESERVYTDMITITQEAYTFTLSIPEIATDGTRWYATVSALGDGNFIVPDGLEVSWITISDKGKMEKTQSATAGSVISGDGAYFVEATDKGDYKFVCTTDDALTPGVTWLYPAIAGQKVTAPLSSSDNDKYTFYKLSLNGASKPGSIGFYWGAKDGVPFTFNSANKAYLAVPKTNPSSNNSSINIDSTTGISTIAETGVANDATYSLSGVRMNSDRLPKGIYIVNGKKMIVK